MWGKGKSRFNELVEDVGGFTISEIIKIGKLSNLTLTEMGTLIEQEYLKNNKNDSPEKASGYESVRPMFEDQKIVYLEDIFVCVKKTKVAGDIGRKRDRFSYLMNHVEKFFVKDIVRIGELCELTIVEMFKVLEAQYAKQYK